MGRKGKRAYEQSESSSTLPYDYETIRVVPSQKLELAATDPKTKSVIPAPPGLDASGSTVGPSKPGCWSGGLSF